MPVENYLQINSQHLQICLDDVRSGKATLQTPFEQKIYNDPAAQIAEWKKQAAADAQEHCGLDQKQLECAIRNKTALIVKDVTTIMREFKITQPQAQILLNCLKHFKDPITGRLKVLLCKNLGITDKEAFNRFDLQRGPQFLKNFVLLHSVSKKIIDPAYIGRLKPSVLEDYHNACSQDKCNFQSVQKQYSTKHETSLQGADERKDYVTYRTLKYEVGNCYGLSLLCIYALSVLKITGIDWYIYRIGWLPNHSNVIIADNPNLHLRSSEMHKQLHSTINFWKQHYTRSMAPSRHTSH